MKNNQIGIGLLALMVGASCDDSVDDTTAEQGEEALFGDREGSARERAEDLTYAYLFDRGEGELEGVDDVWVQRVHFDPRGEAHVHLTQFAQGVPVFGARSIVHLRPDGTVGSVTDNFTRGLRVDTAETLSEREATDAAIAEAGGASRLTKASPAELGVLPSQRGARLVYRVQLSHFEPGFEPSMPLVFIDAHDGSTVWSYDNLQHVQLDDSDKRTYDMASGTNYGAASTAESSDPVANDAHVHAGATLAYFQSAHGRDSFSGSGTRIDSYVHYSNNYVNAYWDGQRLTYGDGDGVISTALTTLDIVAHEFGHGVTSYSADLIYQNESGALNEATSDIFAAAVEHAQGGSVSDVWSIGEDCWLQDPYYLRNMADPQAAGDFDYYPTRYQGGSDNGGVHWNSGIANLFFYLLSEGGTHPRGTTTVDVSGIGIDAAAAIWYRALTVYMDPSTTFSEARLHTLAAASDLDPAFVGPVDDAWAAVGVLPPPDYEPVETRNDLEGGQGSAAFYGPYDASAYDAIRFGISGGSGDADLYVRFGDQPSTSSYDCRPYLNGNEETCEFSPSQSGSYYVMLRGYSPYAGVTLWVEADGAAPSLEVCDDEQDNDGDGSVDCEDSDCTDDPSCQAGDPEVCDDEQDNDGDGSVDCEDPDCEGDLACTPAEWSVLFDTDFEGGWGMYNDGGSDARRSSKDSSYAHSGTFCARIRDDSGVGSSFFSDPFSLTDYDELQIDFWYYARSMENGEDFFVELWDGAQWQVVGRYARGVDFENESSNHEVVVVDAGDVTFGSGASLRFRNDASGNKDWIYVDDIVVSAR